MSTRSTLILTNSDEHWYEECCAAYNLGCKTDDAIVLEISNEHKVEEWVSGEGMSIIIEEGTNLYGAILEAFGIKKVSQQKQLEGGGDESKP